MAEVKKIHPKAMMSWATMPQQEIIERIEKGYGYTQLTQSLNISYTVLVRELPPEVKAKVILNGKTHHKAAGKRFYQGLRKHE